MCVFDDKVRDLFLRSGLWIGEGRARLMVLVRADDTSKGLFEMKLRFVAGWEKSSAMPGGLCPPLRWRH